jgi:hypothetical protein
MTNARDNFDDDNLDDDFASFREDLSSADDMPAVDDIDDEFEQLRRKSARGESLDDDLDGDDAFFSEESSGGGSGFAWRDFTPGQRLTLALLVLLNIIMGTIGLLVVTGNLG